MECVLDIKNLHKTYDSSGTDVHAVRGVDLSVSKGEFVAIMGASGSGKSTLLHIIGGLDYPSSGSVIVNHSEINKLSDSERTLYRRRNIGFIFQSYNLMPTLSAVENVALPALLDNKSDSETMDKARELLNRVDLSHRLDHRPQAMSGGEQQRVSIARALMNDPAIILADEPTGNLDTKHAESIWSILRNLVDNKECTVLSITHEPSGATFADRVCFLRDGQFIGDMKPGGVDHASMVASRYTQLVG